MKCGMGLFYYYSMLPIPNACYLELEDDLAYRNMFPLPCANNTIHFEFPMFEDHSYNTICNRKGVMSLMKKKGLEERYILLRTKGKEKDSCNIIGYYKIGESYFQRTDMFDNNGFVWGFKSSETHLLKKEDLVYEKNFGRNYRLSWKNKDNEKLFKYFIDEISKRENFEKEYQNETNRLVRIFKNQKKIDEWKECCEECQDKSKCTIYRRFKIYNNRHPDFDMFDLIHHVYNSDLYSRNKLNTIKKEYIHLE